MPRQEKLVIRTPDLLKVEQTLTQALETDSQMVDVVKLGDRIDVLWCVGDARTRNSISR
jgi:hypothetical protein